MSTTLTVVSAVANLAWNAWLWSCIILRFAKLFRWQRPRVLVFLREEIRPFAPIAGVAPFVTAVLEAKAGHWLWLIVPLNLGVWWIYRNDKDDDDRWKRRKEKLAAKVAEVGGRLQVVSAGAS